MRRPPRPPAESVLGAGLWQRIIRTMARSHDGPEAEQKVLVTGDVATYTARRRPAYCETEE